MAARRVAGEPIEYIVGWAEFAGLRMVVAPGVFVPRHRTEFLVERALAVLPPDAVVLDLCCGSGAIGAAISAARPDAVIYATDIDPVAVECARQNVPAGYVDEGDLFDPLPQDLMGRIDVIVACPPYVPSDQVRLMPREAQVHEARTALDGGEDGLSILRRIARDSVDWLRHGGQVMVEISRGQAETAERAFGAGYAAGIVSSADQSEAIVTATKSD